MSGKKLITVIGATGAQGGGVVDALLKNGKWAIRAVTRKPDGEAANNLRAQGVEIAVADLDNKEQLSKAFSGADAVFAMTQPYESMKEGVELAQGKLMVDVAKEQKVNHFVFSSLENAEEISNGKHHVAHFTNKAGVADYASSSGIPATFVQIACYFENMKSFFRPKRNAEGIYEFGLPIAGDIKFASGSVEELGQVVVKVLENRDQYLGKKIAVAGDLISANEMASTLSKLWKVPVKFNPIPTEVYATFFPHAAEMADMFGFFNSCGYFGEKVNNRDVFEDKKVSPLSTLWASAHFPTPDA